MGWVLYCKHIYIVTGSVCTCHYNKNIQYNTIHNTISSDKIKGGAWEKWQLGKNIKHVQAIRVMK